MARRNRYFGGLIGASPVVPYDEHWDDVTLLLDGSSTTNDLSYANQDASITNNGSTASVAGPTGYGTVSALSFNGTTQYLKTSYYTASLYNQDFTIEGWFNIANTSTGAAQTFFSHREDNTVVTGVTPYILSSGSRYGLVVGDGTVFQVNVSEPSGSGTVQTGWHHIAVTRSGDNYTLFVDGVSILTGNTSATVAVSGDFTVASGTSVTVAQYLDCEVFDFRITEGIARYTLNFTPPTASLPTTADPIRPGGVSNLGLLGGDNAFEAPSLDLNFDGQLSSFTRATTSPIAAKANGDQLATEIVTQNKTGTVQSKYMGPNGKLINGYVDNLVPHSTDFSTSAGWTHGSSPSLTTRQADPFGGMNATTIEDDDNGAYEYIQTTGVSGTNDVYTASIFIKKQSGTLANQVCLLRVLLGASAGNGPMDLQIDPSDGSYSLIDKGSKQPGVLEAYREDFGDWWRFSLTTGGEGPTGYSPTSGRFDFFPVVNTKPFITASGVYDAATQGAVTIFGAQFEVAGSPSQYVSSTASPAQVPRVEYDASGNPLGLLSEESRTNLWPNGQSDFGNATAGGGSTASTTAVSAPDGTTDNIWAITESNTAGSHHVYTVISVLDSRAYTASYYLKKGSEDYGFIYFEGTAFSPTERVWFDLTNGTVGTETGSSVGRISDAGNGWYRCSVTTTSGTTLTSSYISVGFSSADGSVNSSGASALTGYYWGMQVEQGEGPTSLIYDDTTSSVTRPADDITLATSAFGTNRAANSAFVDFSAGKVNSNIPGAYRFEDATVTANNEVLYYDKSSSELRYQSKENNSATQWAVETNVSLPFSRAFAVRVNGTEAQPAIDGVLGSTQPLTTAPSTALTTLQVGRQGSNWLNGHIRRFTYWPRAISDVSLVDYTGANPPTIDIDKPTQRWGGITGRSLLETEPAGGDVNWNDVALLLDGSSTNDVTGLSTVTPSASGYTTNNTSGAKFNHYIDLQGTGYFNVAFPSALGVSNEPFTVETWVYFDAISNDGVFQLYQSSSSLDGSAVAPAVSIAAAVSAGKWIFYDYGGNITNLGTAASGNWYHVAVVYDGTDLVLYVDGTALKTTTRSMPAGGWTSIGIGGYYTTSFVMDGRIEGFRVTKGVARYTAAFNTDPVITSPAAWPTSAPVAAFTLPTTGRVTLLEHYQSKL